MSLPFLPGNTFDRKIGQNKHHLSHHFDTKNGVQMMVGENRPGVGGVPLAGQDLRPKKIQSIQKVKARISLHGLHSINRFCASTPTSRSQ